MQEELDSCREAGEQGPAAKRDEGSGETEGVSPGAIWLPVDTQSGPGRIRGLDEGSRLPSFLSSLSLA